MKVLNEKLISDFPVRKIGYRAVYSGIVQVGTQKIPYKRYCNITDIDNCEEIYITDTIELPENIGDILRDKIEEYLIN